MVLLFFRLAAQTARVTFPSTTSMRPPRIQPRLGGEGLIEVVFTMILVLLLRADFRSVYVFPWISPPLSTRRALLRQLFSLLLSTAHELFMPHPPRAHYDPETISNTVRCPLLHKTMFVVVLNLIGIPYHGVLEYANSTDCCVHLLLSTRCQCCS